MPLELGIDLGCRRYKGGKHQQKRCLILDKENYRYQKAISDLSGNDIAYHGKDPEKMVRQVRNWMYHIKKGKLSSGKSIWTMYNEFAGNFEK